MEAFLKTLIAALTFFFYGNVIYTILVSQECHAGIYFHDCRVHPFRSLGAYYVLCFVLLYCGDCGDCIGTTFLNIDIQSQTGHLKTKTSGDMPPATNPHALS